MHISLTSFNITSANNSIENLRIELKNINEKIYNSKDKSEIEKLTKEAFNKSIELLKKEGKVEIINPYYRVPSELAWHTYLKTWDIILFSKWDKWDHALVMYDTNTIFEIYWYWTVSKKSNKSVM